MGQSVSIPIIYITHKYHQARNAKPENTANAIGAFSSLAEKFADYELITRDPGKNRYALAKARHLDKYLKRKAGQASRHHGLPFPEDLVTFGSVVIKKDGKDQGHLGHHRQLDVAAYIQ